MTETGARSGESRKRRKMEKLTLEQITAAALKLVDAAGLDGLTMRALSDVLDVQPPVLYRHFADKRDLVDAMAEFILGEVHSAHLPEGDPLEQLTELVHRLRRAILGHRDGARILGGSYAPKSNTLRTADVMMRLLGEAGFEKHKALWIMTSLHSFVLGEVLEQQGLPGDQGDAAPSLMEEKENVVRELQFRHLDMAVLARGFLDFDGRFDFGLRLILKGAEAERSVLT